MIPTMILLFVVGYLFIALEHKTRIDKSAVALLMAGAIWTVFSLLGNDPHIQHELVDQLGDTCEILVFLIGANSREAIAEIEADLNEGADIIMVKPAMSYLDIVKEAREKINAPICVYNVSGEYAMVKNAGEVGLINEKLVALEMLLSMKRAGAKMIITYYALEAAKWLKEDEI